MSKGRLAIISVVIAAVVAILLLFFLFPWHTENRLPSEPVNDNQTATDLGFTYLPVTPQISAYYGLGVDSGALITEVNPESPASKAGMEVGDVILSYNGARVEETAPLLGMIMACPAGNRIELEVWRGKSVSTIELIHMER